MRLYIAGPMGGHYRWNRTAFNSQAEILRKMGHEVVNPIELDEADGLDTSDPAEFGGTQWSITPQMRAWFLRRDFHELTACNGLVLLKGWEESVGANLELLVAMATGLDVFRGLETPPYIRPYSAYPSLVLVEGHLKAVSERT